MTERQLLRVDMKIIDDQKLLPDQSILLDVVKKHPLDSTLFESISSVVIIEDKSESIEYDFITSQVRLRLADYSYKQENIKYILYHEFTHVVDKISPKFKYSEELKASLTNTEKLLVMEIWNVYIDARLHKYGLFQLGNTDANVKSLVNGKVQKLPFTIEGKLLRHTGFMKSSGLRNAKELINDIWQGRTSKLSYPKIVRLVKTMSG